MAKGGLGKDRLGPVPIRESVLTVGICAALMPSIIGLAWTGFDTKSEKIVSHATVSAWESARRPGTELTLCRSRPPEAKPNIERQRWSGGTESLATAESVTEQCRWRPLRIGGG